MPTGKSLSSAPSLQARRWPYRCEHPHSGCSWPRGRPACRPCCPMMLATIFLIICAGGPRRPAAPAPRGRPPSSLSPPLPPPAPRRPAPCRAAFWSSVGILPPAGAARDAGLIIFTGGTGRWKGIFAVHSWVVFKPENATAWSRYDVGGWGQPMRSNGWAPDGRWFGDTPRVLVDVRGPAAAALIPKVKAAIAAYSYNHFGDCRIWPAPNSNTFTAAVLRAVP